MVPAVMPSDIDRLPTCVFVNSTYSYVLPLCCNSRFNEDRCSSDHLSMCTVCLDKFQDGDVLRTLPCMHRVCGFLLVYTVTDCRTSRSTMRLASTRGCTAKATAPCANAAYLSSCPLPARRRRARPFSNSSSFTSVCE